MLAFFFFSFKSHKLTVLLFVPSCNLGLNKWAPIQSRGRFTKFRSTRLVSDGLYESTVWVRKNSALVSTSYHSMSFYLEPLEMLLSAFVNNSWDSVDDRGVTIGWLIEKKTIFVENKCFIIYYKAIIIVGQTTGV